MISIIAAIGKNRELGKDNKLLWNIPDDLKRFRQLTSGHPIIMGRKTFESIGRVLPKRTNIIITRDKQKVIGDKKYEGAIVVESLEQAIEKAEGFYSSSERSESRSLEEDSSRQARTITTNEIFVIGGGHIFEQALPLVDRLYLTIVDAAFDADTFFPEYAMFTKIVEKKDEQSEAFRFTFLTLER